MIAQEARGSAFETQQQRPPALHEHIHLETARLSIISVISRKDKMSVNHVTAAAARSLPHRHLSARPLTHSLTPAAPSGGKGSRRSFGHAPDPHIGVALPFHCVSKVGKEMGGWMDGSRVLT